MNTKGFKQMLIGEKMPDKDDPKYKERYERDVRAGRKFAKMCRIDKAAAKVQRFADLHKTLFLVIVFGFVGVSFSFNIYRMARAYHYQGERRTATEPMSGLLRRPFPRWSISRAILRQTLCSPRCRSIDTMRIASVIRASWMLPLLP